MQFDEHPIIIKLYIFLNTYIITNWLHTRIKIYFDLLNMTK